VVAAAVADRWLVAVVDLWVRTESLPHPKASINTINITTLVLLRHLQQVVLPVAEARPAADHQVVAPAAAITKCVRLSSSTRTPAVLLAVVAVPTWDGS
jgi:hypothetical protein